MTEREELKPCKCGCNPIPMVSVSGVERWIVSCECGESTRWNYPKKLEAVKEWNRRAEG